MPKISSFFTMALVAISFTAILRSADNNSTRYNELAMAHEKIILEHAKAIAELRVCQHACMRRPGRGGVQETLISQKRHETDWRDTNRIFFAQCLEIEKFTDFDAINPVVLTIACGFSGASNLKYNHISDIRSHHHGGGAIDMWFGEHLPTRCKRARRFQKVSMEFVNFLIRIGMHEKVGLGMYPYNEWTPAIHLDARGNGTYWMRTSGGGYRYFKDATELLNAIIAARKNICSAR